MKLWQKNTDSHQTLESFTVGIDYLLDHHLVPADCMASVAHGRTLHRAGILSTMELESLVQGLREAAALAVEGRFPISIHDEDGHTALENHLCATRGEAGKKIHTGRSRNDQVLTALRLYEKAALLALFRQGSTLVRTLLAFARTHERTPMPGRTHMQTAMPSTVGLWAGALAQAVVDGLSLSEGVLGLVDRSPLGSAAGYGVPLPLDRDHAARQMGFSRVHTNVIAAANSRGKLEGAILDVCDQVALDLSKYAQDLILFSLPEFGYFKLPDELTSGSSIMPQKKNPDGLELMRAKSASIGAWTVQVKSVVRSLPTGYNRDFQETKEPLMRGLSTLMDMMVLMDLTFQRLQVNGEALARAFTPDIFATDEALRLVEGGMAFRDAYRQVGLNLQSLELWDLDQALARRTSAGSPGNPAFSLVEEELSALEQRIAAKDRVHRDAVRDCLGMDLDLFTPGFLPAL